MLSRRIGPTRSKTCWHKVARRRPCCPDREPPRGIGNRPEVLEGCKRKDARVATLVGLQILLLFVGRKTSMWGSTMLCRTFALSLLVVSVAVPFAKAQTGFSTKTYPAVLSSANDNNHLIAADLNADGRADLVAYGSRYSQSTVPGNVFLNDGTGNFGAPMALPGSGVLAAAAIGDMNGDGYPDIVGCQNVGSGQSQSVSVVVYLNSGNGTFKALPAVTASGQCNAVALGDPFYSGHLSVITGGYLPGQYNPGGQFFPGNTSIIVVFSNDGTGALQLKETMQSNFDQPNSTSDFTNCGLVGMAGGDLQQNGGFDLLVTTNCQPSGENLPGYEGTAYYVADGPSSNPGYTGGTYLQSEYELYLQGQAVDLQGTGKLDAIFLGNQNNTSGDLIVATNSGYQQFTFAKEFTSGYFEGATYADFNGDGITDLATTYDPNTNSGGSPGPPDLTILAGVQGGTYTSSQTFATGPTATSLGGGVVATDFNGDGKPDIATLVYESSNRTTSLNVYLNTQSGRSNPCSAPSSSGTNIICSPASGAGVDSPVTVNAASNITGFTLNRLYLDNQAVYQTDSQSVSTPIPASSGTHNLVLVSYDNKGNAYDYSVHFTVDNGCIPSSAGVTICSPVNGQTYQSQITVTSGARAQTGTITAMRVYVDNTAVYTSNNPSQTTTYQFTQDVPVTPGTHNLVVVAYESTGAAETSSLTFTVPSSACTAPTDGTSIRLCSPTTGSTVTSPVTVSAGAYTSNGYIASMRIYVDNSAVALVSNNADSQAFSIDQAISVASGQHNLVVVAYPSGGGAVTSSTSITVQ